MNDFDARPDGLKMCVKCGEELPATSDYFHKDSAKDDGFKSACKVCESKKKEQAEQRRIDEHVRMMDEASLKVIQQISRGGSDVPHIAEVYQCIMQAFDGAGGFAAHFMNQYLSAKPGSSIRSKMMADLIRMSVLVSESGAAQIPVDLLTDQDLQNKLAEEGKRIFRIPNYVDGSVEKAS